MRTVQKQCKQCAQERAQENDPKIIAREVILVWELSVQKVQCKDGVGHVSTKYNMRYCNDICLNR